MKFNLGQNIIDKIRGKKGKNCHNFCEDNYSNYKNCYSKEAYSIDGEDMVLAAFYDEELATQYKGVFVDIGAHHPKRFSNTQFFYEKGWRGINIDATPQSMVEFAIQRPEDINLEIAIAPIHKKMKYYMFEESALNTFDETIAHEYMNYSPLKDTKMIEAFTLTEILDKYIAADKKIDFLNIDVEGFDLEIIKTLNFIKYKPSYILIEDLDLMNKDISLLSSSPVDLYLKKHNYFAIAKTKRTIIYKNKEI